MRRVSPKGGGTAIRVTQVGLGFWGRSWMGVVGEAPGVELVAVVDPDPEALERAKALPGYAGLDDALAAVSCDAVLVASPPQSHHAVAKAAMRDGKHVLCEKPLATSLEDALDLAETADREERLLVVSQNYRYNAPFRAVQRTIREGLLGNLVSIKIGCRRDTRTLFAPDDFRYSMRHPYVLDMSIHHFDLLRAVTGQDVRSVFARSWPVPDSPFIHHPAIAAVLHLDNGVPVFYEGDWATHEQETSWNGEWQIVGERGQLFWRGDTEDRGKGEVSLQRWGGEPRAVEQEDLEFVERMATLQALREAIEGGGWPETAAADNVKSLAVVLGCVTSIENGDSVDVSALLAAGHAKL